MVLLLIYVKLSKVYVNTWSGFDRACFQNWGEFLKLGIAGCIAFVLTLGVLEVGIILPGLLGPVQQASFGIITNLLDCLLVHIPFGISVATSIRVGQNLGSGNGEGARKTMKTTALLGLVLGCSIYVPAALCCKLIPQIYTSDPVVLETTWPMFLLASSTIIDKCIGNALVGTLRGCGRHWDVVLFFSIPGMVLVFSIGIPLMFATWLKSFGYFLGFYIANVSKVISIGVVVLKMIDWDEEVRLAGERVAIKTVSYTHLTLPTKA